MTVLFEATIKSMFMKNPSIKPITSLLAQINTSIAGFIVSFNGRLFSLAVYTYYHLFGLHMRLITVYIYL